VTDIQIVQPGQVTRIAGEGMPVSKAGSAKKQGDLLVKWNVIFPTTITTAQKQELRKVLG
jgi:DnaJ family protein B protein 4